MKVTLLGTGCPQCHTKRYGPASLVRHGEVSVLVDCGSGVTQRLVAAGCPGGRLDAVLLTHLHSDHLVDLYQLIVSGWHQGRTVPQRIYGPKGTRAFVDGLLEIWKDERELRIAHERRPTTAGFTAEVVEFGEGPVVELPGLSIAAVHVDHRPVEEAYGFSFRAGDGTTAVFSGDTRYCEPLIAAARGADVLVHECFIHGLMKPVPGARTQEGIDAVASYHTLSSEVGKVAAAAGVKFLMLNHFVPAEFDRDALAAEVAADYAGPFAVGEDLMSYDVATRTLSHGDAHWRLGR